MAKKVSTKAARSKKAKEQAESFELDFIFRIPQLSLEIPLKLKFPQGSDIEGTVDTILNDFIEKLEQYPVSSVELMQPEEEAESSESPVTGEYVSVTLDENTLQKIEGVLELLASGRGIEMKINDKVAKDAQQILNILEENRESPQRSHYKSRHPQQEKIRLKWKTPKTRNHNLYTHEVYCPYCNRQLQVKTGSPQKPATCGDENCQKLHSQKLQRERSANWRKNNKK